MNNIENNKINEDLVSVVTPVFNNFHNLKNTIKSVLNQNYKNIEYIICDDCSDSFNENELKSFIDEENKNSFKYRIIRNDKNLGTVKNINNAYKNVNGKYIINLSANDIFYNENVVRDIIERIKKDNVRALVSSRIVYDKKGVIKELLPNSKHEDKIKKLNTNIKQYKKFIINFIFDMCSGSVLCIKKDLIVEYGPLNEDYVLLDDAPFFADILYKEKISLVTDIVSIYYEGVGVSDTSDIRNVNPIFKKDLDKFLTEKCIEHLDLFNIMEKRRILYRKYRHEINDDNKSERIKLMIKYLPEVIYFKFFNK